MGAKSVRLSWYGDIPTLATQLSIASHFGLSVIIVAQTPLTDQFAATVGLWPQVQVENEPADPVAYAGRFLSARKVYGTRLRLLPAGLSNNVNAATLRAALTAGLGSSGVLCLHAYGTPLVNAIYDRMQMAAAAGWTGAIYFTEIGTKKPAELLPALQAIGLNTPTWIYELWGTDGFTLTTDERATIAKFTGTTP